MITLNYALTKEDYVNYYTYVTWDAPENRKKRMIYYGKQIVPILLFLSAFYYTGLFQRNSLFIMVIAGFLLLTTLLSLMSVRSNSVRVAEKVADDPSNSSIFLETELTFSETGITIKDEMKETRYQWKAFVKKQESNLYYFLFLNAIQAVIIPKKQLPNAELKSQLDKLLAQQLSFDAELGHLLKS